MRAASGKLVEAIIINLYLIETEGGPRLVANGSTLFHDSASLAYLFKKELDLGNVDVKVEENAIRSAIFFGKSGEVL